MVATLESPLSFNMLSQNNMRELSREEQQRINGGWLIVAGVIIVALVLFAAGVYNGYTSTRNPPKKKK